MASKEVMRRRDKEDSKGGPRLGIVVLLSKVDLRILFKVDGLVMLRFYLSVGSQSIE